jgi:hypothetical protein
MTAEPESDDRYLQVNALTPPETPFRGGEDVSFRIAGGTLPGFDVVVKFPLVLLLQSPAMPPDGRGVSVSPGEDLVTARVPPSLEARRRDDVVTEHGTERPVSSWLEPSMADGFVYEYAHQLPYSVANREDLRCRLPRRKPRART